MPKSQLTGKVISDKMKKTVVVLVEEVKEQKKYKRRYITTKKYKAHDEKGQCKIGDKVVIEECRPISKEKKWRVVKKLETKSEETPAEIPLTLVEEKNEKTES